MSMFTRTLAAEQERLLRDRGPASRKCAASMPPMGMPSMNDAAALRRSEAQQKRQERRSTCPLPVEPTMPTKLPAGMSGRDVVQDRPLGS